jgi:hypothetical protein
MAYVEDSVITKQQIEMEVTLASRGNPLSPEAKSELERRVRDALIENKMIAKEFERMKGQLPEFYVQKKYDEIQRMRFDGDPLKLMEALRHQGTTKMGYKDRLREDAIVSCMYERNIHKPNSVSPLDIQSYYQAHRAEFVRGKQFDIDQIIVKKEDTNALSLVQECLKGECSYGECYRRLSQIVGVSLNRMDNIAESEVLPAIAEKMATIPVGSFGHEFVEIDGSVVSLGVRGVREAHALSLGEAWEDIELVLLNEQCQWLHRQWLDQLKQKAYCVIL